MLLLKSPVLMHSWSQKKNLASCVSPNTDAYIPKSTTSWNSYCIHPKWFKWACIKSDPPINRILKLDQIMLSSFIANPHLQVVFWSGAVAGAGLSAYLSGTWGTTTGVSPTLGFLGGATMLLGARMASGCTR